MNQSEEINELATALSKFQGEMTAVKKDATNPFFKSKYATLDTIWEAIRKPLASNGLSIVQTMGTDGDSNSLITTLLHGLTGQYISGEMTLNPEKNTPQGLGSAITYARRYSLSAILGIVADEDDDAESTKEKKGEKAKQATGQTSGKSTKRQGTPKGTKKFDTTTLPGALDFLEDKYPTKWGHLIVAGRLTGKYGVTGDTMEEMIGLLDPEQKEEFTTIVSSEVIKANS